MMKMNMKYGVVALALAAILCVGIAYACFTIESNQVKVTINYTLSLTYTYSGSVVHLSAHLEAQGNPVGGATITFYLYNGTAWNSIGTQDTGSGGNALFDYATTGNGIYYFKATYYVP
jgi:hypothetical protein